MLSTAFLEYSDDEAGRGTNATSPLCQQHRSTTDTTGRLWEKHGRFTKRVVMPTATRQPSVAARFKPRPGVKSVAVRFKPQPGVKSMAACFKPRLGVKSVPGVKSAAARFKSVPGGVKSVAGGVVASPHRLPALMEIRVKRIMTAEGLGCPDLQQEVIDATHKLMQGQPQNDCRMIVEMLTIYLRHPETKHYGQSAINRYVGDPEIELNWVINERKVKPSSTNLTMANELVALSILTAPTNGKGGFYAN